ncbi:MAG TPA: hypothetical protein VK184_21445 [Nostocaceae cyanobacterium]|nr:hypothetical protein [Nostocaceae cyanobacterium]
MVITVVVINLLISLLLMFVAWQVWKLKQVLAVVADKLSEYERASYNGLHPAPENINLGQQGVYSLRQKQQGLKQQIQKAQQIISLMVLGRNLWRRYFGKSVYRLGKTTSKTNR